MRSKTFFISTLSLLAMISSALSFPALYGQSSPEVEAVVREMHSWRSFKATIVVESEGTTSRAELAYQSGKFQMRFTDGRVIASNGHQVIVYNPETGVGGRQDLDPTVPVVGGLDWLLHGFQTTVEGRSARLKALNPAQSIQEVRMKWGDDHRLTMLSIRYRNADNNLTVSLSALRKVESFPASVFSYKPPAGTRTVDNPLNQSN